MPFPENKLERGINAFCVILIIDVFNFAVVLYKHLKYSASKETPVFCIRFVNNGLCFLRNFVERSKEG